MKGVPNLLELPSTIEQVTGYPLRVVRNAAVVGQSALIMANNLQKYHLLQVNRESVDIMDYIMAYQSCHIFRFYSKDSKIRRDAIANSKALYYIEKLIKRLPAYKNLPSGELMRYTGQVAAGLLLHLLNIPVSLRIEEVLKKEYASLANQQKIAVMRTLKDHESMLSVGAKRNNPIETHRLVLAINAAYAQFWSDEWKEPGLAGPYEADGIGDIGRNLVSEFRSVSDVPELDDALIDTWATHLGIRSWYDWEPTQRIGYDS